MSAEAQNKTTFPDGSLAVESLDIEAQGIAHRADGKVIFIDGALPFEQVSVSVHRKKNNWEAGTVTAIHRESSQRVRPGCPHFGLHAGACGGCKMQHLHPAGGQPLAPGQGQGRNAAAPHRRPHLGLPLPRAPVGAACAQKRRGADRLS
jgi:hypothetical protein